MQLIKLVKPLLKWAPYVVIPLILILLVYIVDWSLFFVSISKADPILLLCSLSLSALYPIIGAARWKQVVKSFEINLVYLKSLEATMIAFSANIILPAKTGDFVKALITEVSIDKKKLASAVIAERIGDLAALAILSMIGGFIIRNYFIFYLGSIIIIGITLIVIFVSKFSNHFYSMNLTKTVHIIIQSIVMWRENFLNLFKAFFWSLLNWILGGFQVWLIFLSLQSSISLKETLSGFPATVLISIIPLTPGGIGLRESAYIYIFKPFSPPHLSLGTSLVYYCFTTGLLALIGSLFVYLYLDKKNIIKKLNH